MVKTRRVTPQPFVKNGSSLAAVPTAWTVKQPPHEKNAQPEKSLQKQQDSWVSERASIEFTGKLRL
jgi:hypothetical protein